MGPYRANYSHSICIQTLDEGLGLNHVAQVWEVDFESGVEFDNCLVMNLLVGSRGPAVKACWNGRSFGRRSGEHMCAEP